MIDRQTLGNMIERAMITIGILGTLLSVIFKDKYWLCSAYIILLCIFIFTITVDIIYYTLPIGIPWLKIRRGISLLLDQFSSNGYSPDLVIGVGRSGAIIGATIAANLGHRPFIALDVEHKTPTPRLREASFAEPFSLNSKTLENKELLMTFAYIKTGETYKKALSYLMDQGIGEEKIRFAILYLDPQSNVSEEVKLEVGNRKRVFFAYKRSLTEKQWRAIPWNIKKEAGFK